jgi:signal transduction histidine kinase
MVNDILDFSRLDADINIEKSRHNMIEVVENAVNQLQILTQEHNLKILISKEGEIPDIMFNYSAIERAFINILSNAIKYSPDDSEIQVKISYANDEVEVSVTDHGCGIDAEHVKHIFERFYRVENSTHTVKGTGLGLYLFKTTIEKHHSGKVFVHSEPGIGSTFGFRLPVRILDGSENASIS